MLNLKRLKLAATNPALAFAVLADRIRPGSPIVAKTLLRASRILERNDAERLMRLGDIALIDGDLTTALRYLREAIALQPTVGAVYGMGARLARSNLNDADLIQAVIATVNDETLREMLVALLRSPKAFHASRFWLYFMLYNAFQIEVSGISNFKRTANNNYFTWTSDAHINEQITALEALVGRQERLTG